MLTSTMEFLINLSSETLEKVFNAFYCEHNGNFYPELSHVDIRTARAAHMHFIAGELRHREYWVS